MPALTWAATANAVAYCGAKPVLADVDPETVNLDPDQVARHVTPRTRAVVAVRLFGCAPTSTRSAPRLPGWTSSRTRRASIEVSTFLTRLSKRSDLREAIGSAAQERVRAVASMPHELDRLESRYRTALERARPRPSSRPGSLLDLLRLAVR